MAIANIQAQIANLTSLMLQYIDRTKMQSAPTFGVSYRKGYQANQRPQRGWDSLNTWGYQGHNQSRNNLFSNTYNSDWSDHSNSMWWEPQQVQQFFLTPFHQMSLFLASSCNPRKKSVRKASSKPFQRCKLISQFLVQ